MSTIMIDMYANSIVTDALSTIRVVTPFRSLTGDDEYIAMRMLNEILTMLNVSGSTLPYFYTYAFNTQFGQQKYYFGQGDLATLVINYPVDISYINIFYAETK